MKKVDVNAVGMQVGYNKGAVSNCSARGSVRSTTWSGGLIGWNDGTINRCFTTGDVIGTANTAGGLIGQHLGTITNSNSRASAAGAMPSADWLEIKVPVPLVIVLPQVM